MNRFLKAQLAIFAPFMVRCDKISYFFDLILLVFVASIVFFGFDMLRAFCFFMVFEIWYLIFSNDIYLQKEKKTSENYFKLENLPFLFYFSMTHGSKQISLLQMVARRETEQESEQETERENEQNIMIQQAHRPLFIFDFIVYIALIKYCNVAVALFLVMLFAIYFSFSCMKFIASRLESGEIARELVFDEKREFISKIIFFSMFLVIFEAFVGYVFFYEDISQLLEFFTERIYQPLVEF